MRYNTKTSNQLTLPIGEGKLTSSPVGSHANRSAWPGSEEARMMTVTSGRRCLERSERFGQRGLWAKTFTALLIGQGDWYSTRCYLTWKMKGMKSNRLLFQLVPSTPRIEGTGFGLLPTPQTQIDIDRKSTQQKPGSKHSMGLGDYAKMGMLPTPCNRDTRSGFDPDGEAFTTRQNNPRGVNLHEHIQRKIGHNFQLNHRFVLEMMGFPVDWTELPFQNCETNQSKQPETQ